MPNVLVIGDTHCPCMLEGYVEHCVQTAEAWSCDRIVHIGDFVDNCALSFHLKKPHQKDPVAEYELAKGQVSELCEAFPEADLMLGNHDVLPYRWCNEVGIPEEMMKDFSGIFGLPDGWTVHHRYSQLEIDGVLYQHGDRGKAGRLAAASNAKAEFRSVVQGHHHSQAGLEFICNRHSLVFGLQVGCGVDWKHQQQEYGFRYTNKPVIGCGVVVEGTTPIFEPMLI